MGNGFKVYHYSGALLHETNWPVGQELLQVIWQKYPEGLFTEKPISNVKVQGIEPSQPQSSKAVYVPPNIRSGGAAPVGMPFRSNHQPERGPIPGLPIGYKVSQGQRKKDRNAKRKESENPKQNSNASSNEESNATQAQNQSIPSANNKRNQKRQTPRQPNNPNQTNGNGTNSHNATETNAKPNAVASNDQSAAEGGEIQNNQEKPKRERRNNRNKQRKDGEAATPTPADPEKVKRIRTVQQKLRDIARLKNRRENGENLEVNQLSKIQLEGELVKELDTLKIEA